MLLLTILAGYVLLVEDNEWLRRTSVKAVSIFIFLALISSFIGLIPNAIEFISNFLGIFGGSFSIPLITSIVDFINGGLTLIKTVLFILLGVKALNQGTVIIPFIDSFINKFI